LNLPDSSGYSHQRRPPQLCRHSVRMTASW
jgi:hypothetical protein